MTGAARLRREGRLDDALTLVGSALDDARRATDTTPFRDRVILALTVADLQVLAGRQDRAHELLLAESQWADDVSDRTRMSGSPDQVHAAAAGRHQLHDRSTQVALLGRPAPELEMTEWLDGGFITPAQQRGRVVVLVFWATWCRSCAAMFGFFNGLHDRYAQRGLTVIGLTTYRAGPNEVEARAGERDAIRRTVADHAVTFGIGVAPDQRLQERYGARGIPTFAVIDGDGIVRVASSKPDKSALESEILRLLSATDRAGC